MQGTMIRDHEFFSSIEDEKNVARTYYTVESNALSIGLSKIKWLRTWNRDLLCEV